MVPSCTETSFLYIWEFKKHTVRRLVPTELKVKYIGDEEWQTILFQLLSIFSSQLF